ncbi:MAG: hypothetical protein FJ109_08215 [Deltaproteobacteria bacterium]|nr:hypothetical protein [Deltaproteobacteria bacterium]
MSRRLPEVRVLVAVGCFLAAGVVAALMDYPDRGTAFRYSQEGAGTSSGTDYPLVEMGMA